MTYTITHQQDIHYNTNTTYTITHQHDIHYNIHTFCLAPTRRTCTIKSLYYGIKMTYLHAHSNSRLPLSLQLLSHPNSTLKLFHSTLTPAQTTLLKIIRRPMQLTSLHCTHHNQQSALQVAC